MQKTLLASNSAAARRGPNTRSPAASKASTAPAAKGASGPITVSPTLFSWANLTRAGKSVVWMSTFSPSRSEPALPGATKTRSARGLWAIFQARACSRPPLPTIRMFIMRPPPRQPAKTGLIVVRNAGIGKGAGTNVEYRMTSVEGLPAGDTLPAGRDIAVDVRVAKVSLLSGAKDGRESGGDPSLGPDARDLCEVFFQHPPLLLGCRSGRR